MIQTFGQSELNDTLEVEMQKLIASDLSHIPYEQAEMAYKFLGRMTMKFQPIKN